MLECTSATQLCCTDASLAAGSLLHTSIHCTPANQQPQNQNLILILNLILQAHALAGSPFTPGDQCIAGMGAGAAASLLACPTELVKCRLQAQSHLPPLDSGEVGTY